MEVRESIKWAFYDLKQSGPCKQVVEQLMALDIFFNKSDSYNILRTFYFFHFSFFFFTSHYLNYQTKSNALRLQKPFKRNKKSVESCDIAKLGSVSQFQRKPLRIFYDKWDSYIMQSSISLNLVQRFYEPPCERPSILTPTPPEFVVIGVVNTNTRPCTLLHKIKHFRKLLMRKLVLNVEKRV